MSERHISVTAHEHDGKWVIRLCGPKGFVGLCAANGEPEARLIASVMQGALELHYHVTSQKKQTSWSNGMYNASNIVEGELLEKFAIECGIGGGS